MTKQNIFKNLLNQKGQVFLLAVVILFIVLVGTLILFNNSLTFSQDSRYSIESLQATHLAEAGIDKAVAALNASPALYSGEPESFLGPGSYSVDISPKDSVTYIVAATGYIPDKTQPKAKRTVKIEVSKGTGIAFNYGVQVGDGGLIMKPSSEVRGSIYSNGNITMDNNTKITGDVFVAGGVAPAANQENNCVLPNCTDFTFGKVTGGEDRMDLAQSFEPTLTATLNKISVKLQKNGTPPNLNVKIVTDSSGSPSKTVLSTGTLYASLVSTLTYGFVDVALNPAPLLSANTPYWIIVDTCANSTNCNTPDYWTWSVDTLFAYSRGVGKWSPNWQAGNPSWNNLSLGDLDFKIYLGGVATFIKGSNGATVGHIQNNVRFGDLHANTIEDLEITKDAYFQLLKGSVSIGGTSFPNSADPAVQVMPISDTIIAFWENLAESQGGVYPGDVTTCPVSMHGRYDGNVSLPNGCTVRIDGYVHITGSLNLSNNDILKLNSSIGASSKAIIVDGIISMDNNNQILGSGTNGSYLILISKYSTKNDPLKNWAIDIRNGGNTGVMYSNEGAIRVANNNIMKELTGWKLQLENNVVVEYETGLAGTFFSSGPSGSYSPIKGTYQSE